MVRITSKQYALERSALRRVGCNSRTHRGALFEPDPSTPELQQLHAKSGRPFDAWAATAARIEEPGVGRHMNNRQTVRVTGKRYE